MGRKAVSTSLLALARTLHEYLTQSSVSEGTRSIRGQVIAWIILVFFGSVCYSSELGGLEGGARRKGWMAAEGRNKVR
jgi:hypothetical protein